MTQYHFTRHGKLRNINGIEFLSETVCCNNKGIQLDDNVIEYDGIIQVFESMSVPSCLIFSNKNNNSNGNNNANITVNIGDAFKPVISSLNLSATPAHGTVRTIWGVRYYFDATD